jgi:hypothetical protein
MNNKKPISNFVNKLTTASLFSSNLLSKDATFTSSKKLLEDFSERNKILLGKGDNDNEEYYGENLIEVLQELKD